MILHVIPHSIAWIYYHAVSPACEVKNFLYRKRCQHFAHAGTLTNTSLTSRTAGKSAPYTIPLRQIITIERHNFPLDSALLLDDSTVVVQLKVSSIFRRSYRYRIWSKLVLVA